MPVRFRLLLVALIAMLGMGVATWLGFEAAQSEIQRHEKRAIHVRWAQDCSRLVHHLQRERGASAHSVASDTPNLEQLRPVRAATNRAMELLLENPLATSSRLGRMGLDGLPVKLMEVRKQVDAGSANWRGVRSAYTTSINTLLGVIEFELIGDDDTAVQALDDIADLVLARESLGLLRATVASVQKPDARVANDFIFIASELTLFRRYMARLDERTRELVGSLGYRWVMGAINDTLSMPEGAQDRVNASQWWIQSTAVIDALKQFEDDLFIAIERDMSQEVTRHQRLVMLSGLLAAVFLAALAVFAWATIRHMVLDLKDLADTLNEIVTKENFTARLRNSVTGGELSEAFQMFNRLLSFTERLLREKEYLASMDALTGVMNRRSFLAYAQREMARAQRYGNSLSLLFLDIDHFKAVNDTFGHATGDAVLKAFVGAIKVRARTSDLVARWGGEEFIVLAPETDLQHALAFAESLRDSVAQTQFPEVGRITCSLGVATWVVGESFDGFCARADSALYQAKATGRNRVCAAGNTEPIAAIKEEG